MTAMELRRKTAVVTGASRGIGEAIALKLASLGANIAAVCSKDAGGAEKVCCVCRDEYGVSARTYLCDVSDFDAAKEAVRQIKSDFGSIDILINNAGVTRDGLLAFMSRESFERVLDVNLKGAFNMTRHCVSSFMRARSGCIINVSSASGIMGNAGQSNYSASKAGLIGFTKSVSRELAPYGVRCNAIAPGFIETDMTEGLKKDELLKLIPLGRMGSPGDVADAAAFLVCAEYITGEVLKIDGGLAM